MVIIIIIIIIIIMVWAKRTKQNNVPFLEPIDVHRCVNLGGNFGFYRCEWIRKFMSGVKAWGRIMAWIFFVRYWAKSEVKGSEVDLYEVGLGVIGCVGEFMDKSSNGMHGLTSPGGWGWWGKCKDISEIMAKWWVRYIHGFWDNVWENLTVRVREAQQR